jgi:16S rRNA processing protein RimM
MGRVLAPYGVKGWIKVRPYSAEPNALIGHRRWWLAKTGDEWREFALIEARRHANALVALLEGLSRREDAAEWSGAAVGVPRAALPQLSGGEIYLADLLDLKVVNRQGEKLGRVTELLETPAHAVLRVEDESGREELIPLVSAYVDTIELQHRRIVVDWHRGNA